MRFYLEMELEKPELTKEYRKCILSFIKLTLSECNDGNYKEIYFHNTDAKDYTFTVLLKGANFVGSKITLQDKRIRIRFSTDDRGKTGYRFMNGFLNQKNKSFPLPDGNGMKLRNLVKEKSEKIMNTKVLFRTAVGGGLCIREHNRESNKDKYYTFLDKEFLEQTKNNLKRQSLKAGFGERMTEALVIHPIDCKKIVAKHCGVMLDVTVGLFEMEGDSSLLQYFYNTGAGSRKSSGFGMLDLISQELD